MKQGGGGDGLRKNDLRYRVQQQQQAEDYHDDEYDEISDIDEKELEKLNRELAQASHDIIPRATEESVQEPNTQQEEETNYYKENIFNKEDYYLYRAVMQFYAGDYEKALSDFEQSSSIMHSQKVLYPRDQFKDDVSDEGGVGSVKRNEDAVSVNSSQTDLSDVGLCSLNIHEFSFNTVLCLLMLKDYKKALTKLDYMIDTIPKKYAS